MLGAYIHIVGSVRARFFWVTGVPSHTVSAFCSCLPQAMNSVGWAGGGGGSSSQPPMCAPMVFSPTPLSLCDRPWERSLWWERRRKGEYAMYTYRTYKFPRIFVYQNFTCKTYNREGSRVSSIYTATAIHTALPCTMYIVLVHTSTLCTCTLYLVLCTYVHVHRTYMYLCTFCTMYSHEVGL